MRGENRKFTDVCRDGPRALLLGENDQGGSGRGCLVIRLTGTVTQPEETIRGEDIEEGESAKNAPNSYRSIRQIQRRFPFEKGKRRKRCALPRKNHKVDFEDKKNGRKKKLTFALKEDSTLVRGGFSRSPKPARFKTEKTPLGGG